jgi:hypothetical protein
LSSKQKTILLVSEFGKSNGQYCYADSIFRILEELGQSHNFSISRFDCKEKFLARWLAGSSKINFIFSFIDMILINVYLFFFVKFIQKPDIIFFIKSENINFRIIRYFKKNLKIDLLMFYPDSPFSFFNGNSNSNILMSLPFFNEFWIWSKDLIPILIGAGAINVSYFPFFSDHKIFDDYLKTASELSLKKYDACFVGAWDPKRESYLTAIVNDNQNIKLFIAGGQWQSNLKQNSPLLKYLKEGELSFFKMLEIFSSSHICINILKDQNAGSHNMRTFEVPASKSFLLAEYSREQNDFFKEYQLADYFRNKNELVRKIKLRLSNLFFLKQAGNLSFQKNIKYSLKTQLNNKIGLFLRNSYR